MSLTSFSFIYLLILTLVVYYLLPRRFQNSWLLVVSYAFCISWAWQFALVLLVLTVLNFTLAHSLLREGKPRRYLLCLGIGLNVVALAAIRSFNFFIPELASFLSNLGFPGNFGGLSIVLPIGLSFYTLQNISYLVDVSRKQLPASRDLVAFALYLAYFPKLLAGPIERARTFLPQLEKPRLFNQELLGRSVGLIVIGAVRKLIIADTIHSLIFVDVFDVPSNYSGPELIGFLLMYAFYLYNDFAGYTSLARGISGLFGIRLVENFAQPYFARSFTEFWNSWHISLSHWLRDYIFFPFSRALLRRNPNRKNLLNLVFPPILTMLVSGLWHGFGWSMLLWGGLHGVYQVAERLPTLWRPVVAQQSQPAWKQILSLGIVFSAVVMAWVPFAMDLATALAYWKGMFDWTFTVFRFRRILLFLPLAALVLAIDWLQRHYQDEAFIVRWPRLAQASAVAISLFLILILTSTGSEEAFIYQGF
jgi:alginate O-acetyltransferase complex protein AlgI